MAKNEKLDVHLVEHTHWDREWYFTSDDSRTMLYYNMKFMIDYLLKHNDKFTYDGQSSIIDDFLKYAPEWKAKLSQVVKQKKLYVGPFYTAVDNTVAAGESIMRNLEMGKYLADKIGHSMKVGYLPDTFGHNNQIPQILKMNGINNFSFYRGLDPEKTSNKLYFNYKSPDGSIVLGHWQTHYTTRGFSPVVKKDEYTQEWFSKSIIADGKKQNDFSPSVESYAKRNYNLPIAIPIGTDQRPFSMKMPHLTKLMNDKYTKYNFINSSYENFIESVEEKIKAKKIKLKTITSELRIAKTGRVHRTVASSRIDIKQCHYELEQVLINILEPMSILCFKNKIDVPWKMVEKIWKDLHKSSAHDSYACSNEDPVNKKLENRLRNAIRIARGLIAMLSRIYAQKLISEDKNKYKKLIIFNYKHTNYCGPYQIWTTVKNDYENGQFNLFDDGKKLKYSILERNNQGTHERDALLLLIHNVSINPFSHKILTIEYTKQSNYIIDTQNYIYAYDSEIKVDSGEIIFKHKNRIYKNFLKIALDPSVGDTYDHSPISFNDKKYEINNFKIIECVKAMNTIKIIGTTKIPNGIENWKRNKITTTQDVEMQITILKESIHLHLVTINKSKNTRMILLIDSLKNNESWYHDQQFGIYKRKIKNDYISKWNSPDKYGYKWVEYPTNLSPLQSFVSNSDSDLTIYVQGTKEHELIDYQNKKYFAFTLYRAVGLFGTSDTVYRPGRASGAKCEAPNAQLLKKSLHFDFIIDLNKRNLNEQFKNTNWINLKNFYIPGQWALNRTLLRWNTNTNYYDNDKKKRNFKLKLEPQFSKLIMTAFYKRQNNQIIIRFLNINNDLIIHSKKYKISRTLDDFKNQALELPKYGLVNVLLGTK